jgi:hypothetical protein
MVYFVIARILVNIIGSLGGAVDMVIDHKHNPTDMSLYPILATRVKASSHLSKVRCFTGHFVIPLLVDFFPLHYV